MSYDVLSPADHWLHVCRIRYKGAQIIFWDLGGQSKMRSMWEKYYLEANAVLYVVDSADLGRLEEAKESFGECVRACVLIVIVAAMDKLTDA
jgi:GTPase SAR1 family protein